MTEELNQQIKNIFTGKRIKKILTFGWISALIFLLSQPAHAQGAADATMASLATILYYILQLVVNGIAGLATAMDVIFSIGITGTDGKTIQVVQTTWALVRNFSNMFFIIGLIVMAFATIFDLSRYNFRTLIIRFLIIALLINFSLVIGETIIDWTQSLSSVFLTAMGSYGNLLGGQLDTGILLGEPSGFIAGSVRPFLTRLGPAGAAGVWATFAFDTNVHAQVTQMFFSIILGSIIFFSLLVGVIFTAIRIPILWALLILAPAAWVSSIFPPLADANRRWWKQFLGWNFFLPIYLFFLYVGMLFMQNQKIILSGDAQKDLIGIGFAFQTLFFYAFVGMFMIYGVKFAMSAGMAAGAGSVAGAIWAKGTANARLQRGTMLGGAWRMTPVPGAYKEAKDYVSREGFAGTKLENIPIIGGFRGKRGFDERVGSITGSLGLPGSRQSNIQSTEEGFRKAGYTKDRLDDFIKNGSPEQKIAAANILKGQYRTLTGAEVSGLYQEYKKLSPADAAKWIRGQKDAIEGLGKTELNELEATADPQMKQFIAHIKAKKDLISDTGDWEKKLSLFRTENGGNDAAMATFIGESKEFLERLDPDIASRMLGTDSKGDPIIPPANKEAIKKYANLIAKKGIDTTKLMELTGEGGAFESPSEREAFLNLAKEGNIVGALEAKLQAGVLRDMVTKEIIKVNPQDTEAVKQALDKALEQEYDKLTPKTIASQQFRDNKADPSKNLGLADPRALAALVRSLGKSRPERLSDFYKNDEFMSSGPLAATVEPKLKELRQAALRRDKLEPLEDAVTGILSIIPQIKSFKDNGDKLAADKAVTSAQALLDKVDRLNKSISSDSSFADEDTKDRAGDLFADAKNKFEEAKKYSPKKP